MSLPTLVSMVIYSKPRGGEGRLLQLALCWNPFPLVSPSLPHVSIKARQPIDKLALPCELSDCARPALPHAGRLWGTALGCGLAGSEP